MTAGPPPDGVLPADALPQTVTWLDALADDLHAAVGELRRLADGVGRDWRDAGGREWVGQVEMIHRDLGRHAELGTELARAIGRIADDLVVDHPDGPTDSLTVGPEGGTGPADRAGGPRLGGTEGERVEPGYGMRIPTLPDDPVPGR